MLAQSIATRTSRDWIEALEAATVPCGPINSLKEVFADPQVVERGMRVDARDAVSGTVPLVRSPIRLSETPVQTGVGPPALGEHTNEVLTGLLGMTPAEVDALRARRIV
jgi:crotonobetainyl-CoA:carnitine CoA-transferase CaiB-like acyl-CoA transferase